MIGYENLGFLIKDEKYQLVKKAGQEGSTIAKHHHPSANVLFTVVKGKVEVHIDNTEKVETFILEPGKVLSFDGNNYIDAKLLEDSEVFVTLIEK